MIEKSPKKDLDAVIFIAAKAISANIINIEFQKDLWVESLELRKRPLANTMMR